MIKSGGNNQHFSEFKNRFINDIFMNGKKLLDISLDKHGSAVIETCIEGNAF